MYYVIEIATGDPKIEGKAIYQYDTIEAAVGAFHSKLGTAMKSDLYATELIMVMDDEGAVLRVEKYIKPIPVTE